MFLAFKRAWRVRSTSTGLFLIIKYNMSKAVVPDGYDDCSADLKTLIFNVFSL